MYVNMYIYMYVSLLDDHMLFNVNQGRHFETNSNSNTLQNRAEVEHHSNTPVFCLFQGQSIRFAAKKRSAPLQPAQPIR